MDFKFKKKYGQNFLKDENIVRNIVNSVNADSDDLIIEIGLGSGALTKYLVDKTEHYLGYEIDLDAKRFLVRFESNNKIFIYDDFLKRNVLEDIKDIEFDNLYIVGNLPYYITTPIILKIIDEGIDVKECIFMVQKEVAERFSSKPGNKEYGAISVLLNYYFEIEYLFNVGRKCFIPPPNVDSAVIKLKKKDEQEKVDKERFNKFIRDAFQFKRKNLRNNLKSYNLSKIEKVLNSNGFDLNNRAEDLPVEIFIKITNDVL